MNATQMGVLADLQQAIDACSMNDLPGTAGTLLQVHAAVGDLIDQRDALVGLMFGLVQSLPKGPRSLSSNAQAYVREGATLACAILDRHEIDPEAFNRYARTLWGTEWRASREELRARMSAALARIGGAQ